MSQNLPLLNELISLDELPTSFFSENSAVLGILEKFHYKNLVSHKSIENHQGYYSLTVVSFENLDLEIAGANGLALSKPLKAPSSQSSFVRSLNG